MRALYRALMVSASLLVLRYQAWFGAQGLTCGFWIAWMLLFCVLELWMSQASRPLLCALLTLFPGKSKISVLSD
jgi:hypothetical protein